MSTSVICYLFLHVYLHIYILFISISTYLYLYYLYLYLRILSMLSISATQDTHQLCKPLGSQEVIKIYLKPSPSLLPITRYRL